MGKIYTIDEITAAVKPIAEKYGIDKVWQIGRASCRERV